MIPRDVLEGRWRRAQAALEESGLDVLVAASRGTVATFGNVHWLTGYAPMLRPAYAVLRRDGAPLLVASSDSDALVVAAQGSGVEVVSTGSADAAGGTGRSPAQAVAALLRGAGRVGVAGLLDVVPVADADVLRGELAAEDAGALFAGAKRRKDAWDVERLRDAMALAGRGLDAGAAALAGGARRAQEVVGEVERVVRGGGALEALVFVDREVAFARKVTPTVFAPGDVATVLVEVATEDGYWVELGGLFSLGEAGAAGAAAGATSYAVLAELRSVVAPGLPVAAAYERAAAVVAAAGLELGLGLGHGVGTDHDAPRLGPGVPGTLLAGDVLSIHPNVIDRAAGLGGAAADALHVTGDGCETLGGAPWAITAIPL